MNSASQEIPLQQGEDGRVRLLPDAMKDLDEGFEGNYLTENANALTLSEEEWKMQEARRQLEEAARQ